jgi:hypothetical protein
MERRQFRTARIDLLSQLDEADFWGNIDKINQELAAYSSEEPDNIPPRYHPDTLALELSACHSNPQYLGETATVTIAHESPNGELSIEQITGELGLFTCVNVTSTEECDGAEIATNQRVAALQIGETAVPLSPETLLQLDIEKPTPDEDPNDTFSYIISRVREINTLLAKPSYQAASPSEQTMLQVNAVENVNQYLDDIANNDTMTIVTLRPDSKRDNNVIWVKYIYVTIESDCPQFEIIDINDRTCYIPQEDIINIEMTDNPVSSDEDIDVIDFFNNEALQRAINDFEAGIDDLDSLSEKIDQIIGYDYFCQNGMFSGQGVLYRQTASGEVYREPTTFTQLLSQGFDVLEIDGKRRLVIALEDLDNPSNDLFYLIPDRAHLNQCIRQTVPDALRIEPYNYLSEDLQRAARAAEKLIKSYAFMNTTDIDQQRIMFEEQEAVKNVRSDLSRIFNILCQECQICCIAKKYWAIDLRAYSSDSYSPKETAQSAPVTAKSGEEFLEIYGDVVDFIIPEMFESDKKITSMEDFPLSEGKPMIQIIDARGDQRVYFVPIADFFSVRPLT